MKNFRKYFSLFFLLFCIFSNSQNEIKQNGKQQDEIYRLIRESDQYNSSNSLKSLELANKAVLLAEKIGTSRDRAISYVFVANALTNLNMYKESFKYLEKSLKEEYTKTDKIHETAIKAIKSQNYWKLKD